MLCFARATSHALGAHSRALPQMHAWLYDKTVVEAIFAEAPGRYAERNNDFTKMSVALSRRGDNANMVTLELSASAKRARAC